MESFRPKYINETNFGFRHKENENKYSRRDLYDYRLHKIGAPVIEIEDVEFDGNNEAFGSLFDNNLDHHPSEKSFKQKSLTLFKPLES